MPTLMVSFKMTTVAVFVVRLPSLLNKYRSVNPKISGEGYSRTNNLMSLLIQGHKGQHARTLEALKRRKAQARL